MNRIAQITTGNLTTHTYVITGRPTERRISIIRSYLRRYANGSTDCTSFDVIEWSNGIYFSITFQSYGLI